MERRYLTIEEVAEMLQVSLKTIRNWIKTKELPVIKIGSQIMRFDPEAVDEWFKEQGKKEV
jgi:excisionase family DNA binding protein